MKTRRYVFLAVLFALAAPVFSACGSNAPRSSGDTPDYNKKKIIGFSFADMKEERWQRDLDYFVLRAAELGAKVLVQDAGGEALTQIEQCKNLLLRGAQVLVVLPKNADAAAPIVFYAHSKGAKVLSYDRLIANARPDAYISFDNFRVGEIQAAEILKRVPTGKYLLLGGDPADQNSAMLREGQMKVLQPAVDAGKIQIVASPFCDKWLRAEATRYTEDALARHPDLAAIVASNDGTAGGAIAALAAKGKAGQIAVSGQDADLEACRNVAKGLQTVTVYKPIKKIAEAAARIAVTFADGRGVEEAKDIAGVRYVELDRGAFKVPTFFLDPVAVTKENLSETVVADGFHSSEDLNAS